MLNLPEARKPGQKLVQVGGTRSPAPQHTHQQLNRTTQAGTEMPQPTEAQRCEKRREKKEREGKKTLKVEENRKRQKERLEKEKKNNNKIKFNLSKFLI